MLGNGGRTGHSNKKVRQHVVRTIFVEQATDTHAFGEDLLHGLRFVQAQNGIKRSRRGLPQPGVMPRAQMS